RLQEVVVAGVDVAAGQLLLVGEADGVDEEIQLAPFLLDRGEDGVDGGAVGDVAMAGDKGADLFRQRLDALLQRVALIGKGQFRALIGAGLGDAPGDGAVVRDAKDDAAFAGHQAVSTRHVALLRLLWSVAYRTVDRRVSSCLAKRLQSI